MKFEIYKSIIQNCNNYRFWNNRKWREFDRTSGL